MAETEDTTTIVVPGSEAVAADLNAPAKTNGAAKNVAEEAGADLRRQLDESKAREAREKAGREEAERRARTAESRVGQSETEARSSTLTAVTNAIEARKGALDAAQNALAAFWNAGDFVEAAKVNTRVGELTAELLRLNEAKDFAEQQAKNPPQPQVQTRQPEGVEGFIQTARLPPKSASWLREHPEVLAKQKKLARAHDEALEEVGDSGFESPEYFGIIEKIMGLEKKSQPSTEVEDAEHEPERRAPVRQAAQEQRRAPAAPPSSGASAGSRGETKVRMTPEMRRAAEISGVSEEEYARNWLEAKRQGLIS